jgi:hypothetical protein
MPSNARTLRYLIFGPLLRSSCDPDLNYTHRYIAKGWPNPCPSDGMMEDAYFQYDTRRMHGRRSPASDGSMVFFKQPWWFSATNSLGWD